MNLRNRYRAGTRWEGEKKGGRKKKGRLKTGPISADYGDVLGAAASRSLVEKKGVKCHPSKGEGLTPLLGGEGSTAGEKCRVFQSTGTNKPVEKSLYGKEEKVEQVQPKVNRLVNKRKQDLRMEQPRADRATTNDGLIKKEE